MMPEKDGIETLHEIREDVSGLNRSTPAFILTANAVSGAKEMYLAEGFNGFLTKPINIEKLERTIIETLPDSMIKTTGHSSADRTVSENEETMPDNGAFEAYRIQIHGMKGYAATVGIVPLTGMANILEYAARDRDMDSIRKMHDIFMRIWNSYSEKLEIIVDDKGADELKLFIEDKSVILGRLELLKNAIHDIDEFRKMITEEAGT